MKIVVVGGSGLVGAKLVSMLTRGGHEIVAASRSSGVDAVTGEGLAEALSGAAVVIDVANSPVLRRRRGDEVLQDLNAQPPHL